MRERPLRILLLEDEDSDAELMERELHSADLDYSIERVLDQGEFRRALVSFQPTLILADYHLPTFDGLSALEIAQQEQPHVPFIFVSGAIGEELAIDTLRRGATDYVLKQKLERLVPAVERALREASERDARRSAEAALRESEAKLRELAGRLERENLSLQAEIREQQGFAQIVCESPAFSKVLEAMETVARTDATVLITGETGTGKELIARGIHERSAYGERALVKVNCAALPATLIESELFGHERGAFTGATARKIGRFEIAHGGTIFLDEIGDLPLELQAKLLRVLQEGEFERVGSSTTHRVRVRVIAATNRDLEAESLAGRFRPDLYYRLNVYPIQVPPLRERSEDIGPLIEHFVAKHGPRLGKRIDSIPAAAIAGLSDYSWPGNVRELENLVERALISTNGTSLALAPLLPRAPAARRSEKTLTLNEVQRRHIVRTLEERGWRVRGKGGTAEVLDIKPSTLEARMKKLGIRRPPK